MQTNTDPVQIQMRQLIWICTSVTDFWLKPLFATMDVTKFADERVHFINLRWKGYEAPDPWLSTDSLAKILIKLHKCAGWSESSLGPCVIRYIFSYCGSHFPRQHQKVQNLYKNPSPAPRYVKVQWWFVYSSCIASKGLLWLAETDYIRLLQILMFA